MNKARVTLFCLLLAAVACWSQTRVACIGNSITESSRYTRTLQQLLGSGYIVANAGVGGTTLLKRGYKSYWTEGVLPRVFNFKPELITIMLGTNDTRRENWERHKADFKRDYCALIDTLRTIKPRPRIWIVIPPPSWPNRFGIRDSVMPRIIPILREVAIERGAGLIDARSPLIDFKRYFPDGVHPNAAGADSIGNAIYRGIIGGKE
jgi:acyl-CoA thioesterase-1